MDGFFEFLNSYQNKVFSLLLLLMGIFEIMATYSTILPLVEQKRKLQASIAEIADPKEKKAVKARLGTYDNMFVVLRIIGAVLIAFGILGLAR